MNSFIEKVWQLCVAELLYFNPLDINKQEEMTEYVLDGGYSTDSSDD